jgi:L-ribulose-5-phosphate 4-epimerase
MTVTADIARLREEVTRANLDLVRNGLVVWTGGNASARVPGAELMLIKPSGIDYDDLTPESIVLCDLHGNVVEGDLSPSSDTASHAYIYRHLPSVGGVTHTHSTYACAWAARGEPVPCVLTAMADEFGGDIPCAVRAHRHRGDRRGRGACPAHLGQLGRARAESRPFTIGRTCAR